MAIDPEAETLLNHFADTGRSTLGARSLAQAREWARRHWLPAGPAAKVEQSRIEGPGGELTVHSYRPEHASTLLGGLIFFPGGAFVAAELDGHDALCRELANRARCAVVSVEYRLAPEHPFPAAVDDAYAATCFIHEQADQFGIDHRRLAVGGYGAGAALATTVARLAKERRNPPLAFQLLIHPITDLRSFDTPSHRKHGEHGPITRETLIWLTNLYVRNERDRADPRCSPLAAKNLIGLPPALVVTAEYDPLRDEGEAYADALRQAQVPVTLSRYEGMVHGFVHLHALIAEGRRALHECAQALTAALSG
ncbi:MAG TPA: alpha/beta hydrolase [Polyangiales bacterium]|jgi:acetyl esterase